MAERKIDEQISYNWLFFLLAGAFGAVTFWAVYDETATRREYKAYQETFFDIEVTEAEKAYQAAQAELEKNNEYKKLIAEKKQLDDEIKQGLGSALGEFNQQFLAASTSAA